MIEQLMDVGKREGAREVRTSDSERYHHLLESS